MARRTKEDAEATRNKLLDAAQEVFFEKGVAGASLADIAQQAGLTRGAIYWHFKDKLDLFDALMQRTALPFEQALAAGLHQTLESGDTLLKLLSVLRMVLCSVSTDAVTRRVFDVALYKVECVGEMRAVRERRLSGMTRFALQMEVALAAAAKEAGVELPVPLPAAARGLRAVFDGVLHAWLLDQGASFDLEEEGMAAVAVYLQGLGLCSKKENTQLCLKA